MRKNEQNKSNITAAPARVEHVKPGLFDWFSTEKFNMASVEAVEAEAQIEYCKTVGELAKADQLRSQEKIAKTRSAETFANNELKTRYIVGGIIVVAIITTVLIGGLAIKNSPANHLDESDGGLLAYFLDLLWKAPIVVGALVVIYSLANKHATFFNPNLRVSNDNSEPQSITQQITPVNSPYMGIGAID